jgi:hypothetical protein
MKVVKTSKDTIRKEFKQLSKKDQEELLKEYNKHFSTDDDSDPSSKEYSPKKDESIQVTSEIIEQDISSYLNSIEKLKQYFIGDKYNNSPLSRAIEEGKISQVREMYPIKESLSDAKLLQKIAIDITHDTAQENYHISKDVALRIFSEVEHQLNLMGEDTTEVVEAYNFE